MSGLPPADHIQQHVRLALEEDVGPGDITAALIPVERQVRAHVICREAAVLCGQAWFTEVFRQLDPQIDIRWHFADGEQLGRDDRVCSIRGSARPILSGERTALNFLQTLSGVASVTAHYVEQLAGTPCSLLDTRKTIPGMRLAQKYAVRCGGGVNHRMGLYDAYLIKENHIAASGGIANAIESARRQQPAAWIEVEVENLQELQQAIAAGAERILLDNMDLASLTQAVALTAKRAELEASGGIDLTTLRQIAETGVDFISIGAITKHLRATDFSLCFEDPGQETVSPP
ncbi:MAG: carboxylating nicotinate-nucleotide diphosphorylase [Gammaproteobacteria bacterium]